MRLMLLRMKERDIPFQNTNVTEQLIWNEAGSWEYSLISQGPTINAD